MFSGSVADVGHAGSGHVAQDQRVTELSAYLQMSGSALQGTGPMSDLYRTAFTSLAARQPQIVIGVVVHALPHCHWYKVQCGLAGGSVGCTMLTDGSTLPLGVRNTSVIPPNSAVLVWLQPNVNYGVILGVLPDRVLDRKSSMAGWLQQGGNTGLLRETGPLSIFNNTFQQGGIWNWSGRRPLDATSLDKGWISETGVAVWLDSFQAVMRVSESCGLFLNWWDQYTRLIGSQLDIESYARQIQSRDDEGECQYVEQNIIYPWESVGLYAPGSDFTEAFDDREVQQSRCKGKIDIKAGDEDIQPFARGVEYGGYLGQGYLRFIAAPGRNTGVRKMSGDENDYGLWQEHAGLEGGYSMRSAKHIIFSKQAVFPCPRRVRLSEDQQSGDDARKDNYKFSSKFGNAEEHKVSDLKISADSPELRRAAGVQDYLNHALNWKSVHAFHYHKQDFKFPDQSELENLDRVEEAIDYSVLQEKHNIPLPTAKTIEIDHRYGEVEYLLRNSLLALLEDGSIVIRDGCGAELILAHGNVRVVAAGDIEFIAGRRIVDQSGDRIIRAKNSVDISASDKDVRIKAEQNMQLLAGNSGQGGLLLESKATDSTQEYQNKFGEDVVSSGITLLTKSSDVSLLGQNITLRTGGEQLGDGDITIDASKGKKSVRVYADDCSFFCGSSLDIWQGIRDEDANVTHSYSFSRGQAIMSGSLTIENNLFMTDGGIVANGTISTTKSIIAKGSVSQRGGGQLGDSKDAKIREQLDVPTKQRQQHLADGKKAFQSDFVNQFYQNEQSFGNDDLLEQVGFSYRDPFQDSTSQYRSQDYHVIEPRWQHNIRKGNGTGGENWYETPVLYQGQETYPFPGRKRLQEEESLFQYSDDLWDNENGRPVDRGAAYEDVSLTEWDKVKLDGNLKTIF